MLSTAAQMNKIIIIMANFILFIPSPLKERGLGFI